MEIKNKVTFRIAGLPFTVNTDNDPDYVKEIASALDSRINEILKSGNFISTTQAAVLAALEYEDNASKIEKETEELRAQLKTCLEDAAEAKSERDVLKRELAKVKKEGKQTNS